MTTSIILQTNNENDNTFGDSHFSIILPYTKDHLWAMQLNSFNFRPMFNIFEKNTQYLKVKLYLRYFEPHQSPPDNTWEKKDWVNILSKHVYTFHYEALPFLSSSDFASVGTKIMDENKWSIKWEKEEIQKIDDKDIDNLYDNGIHHIVNIHKTLCYHTYYKKKYKLHHAYKDMDDGYEYTTPDNIHHKLWKTSTKKYVLWLDNSTISEYAWLYPEDQFDFDDLTDFCFDKDKKHIYMRKIETWTEILNNQTIVLKPGKQISDGEFEFIDDVDKYILNQTYHYAKDDPYRDFININMFWYIPNQKYYVILTESDASKEYINVTIEGEVKKFYIDDLLKQNLNHNIYPGNFYDDDDDYDDDDNENILNDPKIDYTHDWGEDSETSYSHYSTDFKRFYYKDPEGHLSGKYAVYNKDNIDYIILYPVWAIDSVSRDINDIMIEEHGYNPHMKWSHFSHDGHFYWKNNNHHYEVSEDKTYFVDGDTKYNINEILAAEEQERNTPEEEEEEDKKEEEDKPDEYEGMRDYGEDEETIYSHYSKDFKRFWYAEWSQWYGVSHANDGLDYVIIPGEYVDSREKINDIMVLEDSNPHMDWSFVSNDEHFYWRVTKKFYDIITENGLHYFMDGETKKSIEETIQEERETDPPEEEEDKKEEEEEADEDLDKLNKLISVGEFLINPLSQYNSTKNRLEIAFEVSMDVLETDNDNNITKRYYSRGYVYKIEIIDITDKLSEITGFVKGQVKEETLIEAKHEIDKNEQKANYLIIRANNMFKPYDFDYLTISCDKVYNTGYIVNQNKYISDPCESTVFYQNQIIGYLMNTVCSNQYMTTGYGFPNKYYIKTSDFLNIRFTLRYDNGEKVDLQSPLTLVLTLSPE